MNLLTKELLEQIPPLYATENESDPMVHVKLFTPDAQWSWYIIEYDMESRVAFGYVCGLENELGYFSIDEIERVRGSMGLKVERDMSFGSIRLSEL
jgi:hypothetical protein